jgi:hypothetical protein
MDQGDPLQSRNAWCEEISDLYSSSSVGRKGHMEDAEQKGGGEAGKESNSSGACGAVLSVRGGPA